MNISFVDMTISSTNLSAGLTTAYICVWTFSLLFVLPTNSYVIWLIVTGSEDRVASEIFILNMSFSEIIFCLFAAVDLGKIVNGSDHKSVQITVQKFLIGNIITIRPLFQCLMCVERYFAVVHPVTFLKYKPLRYRVLCCTAVWMIGLGSCLFWTFLGSFNVYMGLSFIQFLLFLSVQLFCLVAVLRALKQSRPGERKEKEENHMKRRAFKIIVILTVTMLIVFVPFVLSRFLNIMLQKDVEEVSMLSLWCFVLDGFVPALLYLRRVGKIPFLKRL